jgi:aryl carrier-like protein
MSASPEWNYQRMRDDVAAILKTDASEIADDDNLIDHGLDSMRLMRLTQQWHDRGVTVPFADLAERPQLSHWWTLASPYAATGTRHGEGGGSVS